MTSVVPGSGLLLMLAEGSVWGVDNTAVEAVLRSGGGYRVRLGGEGAGMLVAEEILGVVTGLEVQPPAAVVRRFWPELPVGLAVYEGAPIVVIDPKRPPRILKDEEGE